MEESGGNGGRTAGDGIVIGGWGGSGQTAGGGKLGRREVNWGRNTRGSGGSSPERGGRSVEGGRG